MGSALRCFQSKFSNDLTGSKTYPPRCRLKRRTVWPLFSGRHDAFRIRCSRRDATGSTKTVGIGTAVSDKTNAFTAIRRNSKGLRKARVFVPGERSQTAARVCGTDHSGDLCPKQ